MLVASLKLICLEDRYISTFIHLIKKYIKGDYLLGWAEGHSLIDLDPDFTPYPDSYRTIGGTHRGLYHARRRHHHLCLGRLHEIPRLLPRHLSC